MQYLLSDGQALFGSRATFYRYLESAKKAGFPGQYRRKGQCWIPEDTYHELERLAQTAPTITPAVPEPVAQVKIEASTPIPTPAAPPVENLALAQEVQALREVVTALPSMGMLARLHERLERAEADADACHAAMIESLDNLCAYLETEFDQDRARLALLESGRRAPMPGNPLARFLQSLRAPLQTICPVGSLSLDVQTKER